MAIFTITVVTDIAINDALYASKAFPGVEVSIAKDLRYTDFRHEVTVTRSTSGAYIPAVGRYDKGNTKTQTFEANRTMVTHRELMQANGFLKAGDVKYRVEEIDVEFVPIQGDILLDLAKGTRFEVLGVDDTVLDTQYLMWCRAL